MFWRGSPPFPPKKRSCCLKDCFPPFGLGLTYGIARCARTLVSHERFPLFLLSGFCSSFKPPTAEPLVSRSLLEVWGCHCSPCAPRSTAPSRTPCLSRDSHSAYSACCICGFALSFTHFALFWPLFPFPCFMKPSQGLFLCGDDGPHPSFPPFPRSRWNAFGGRLPDLHSRLLSCPLRHRDFLVSGVFSRTGDSSIRGFLDVRMLSTRTKVHG